MKQQLKGRSKAAKIVDGRNCTTRRDVRQRTLEHASRCGEEEQQQKQQQQ